LPGRLTATRANGRSVAVPVGGPARLDAVGLGPHRRGRALTVGRALGLAAHAVALGIGDGAVGRVVPARRHRAALGHLLEALEVAAHAAVYEPEGGAHVLDEALRLVLHVQVDARGVLVHLVEAHLTRVPRAHDALPGDAGVGLVGHDASLPLLVTPGDVRAPVEAVGALATYLLHALHEGGEAFELPEQGVGLSDGH